MAALLTATVCFAQGQAVQPAGPAAAAANAATPRPVPRTIDRIVAIVNDEVVTANELRARARVAEVQLRRQKIQPPSADVLERQVLERMIVDRAQMQLARETGVRVDDATVNAALGRIAETNGLSVQALRQRLEADGVSFTQFRDDIRQDIILNRLREREVDSRVQISDSELENFIAAQSGVSADSEEINLAQILLRVPENSPSDRVDATRVRAEELMVQLKNGTDFARVAASFSNAPEALQGGELGWRNADRLPTLFIDAVKGLKPGDMTPVIRSPNGFHILKVLGRRSGVDSKLATGPVQQTHARHILLRASELMPEPEVRRRLEEMKQRIEAGQIEFGTLARLHSLDPSGSRGGDLGWLYPGDTVPEFEKPMNALKLNEVSRPVQSPFGWHLIQVLERRTEQASSERARLQARQALRDRKADEAYQDWMRQLRDKTYVEYRLDDRS
ncbi:MAG TPA: peptidylprolyl isomerase [Burkholderiaceae bacterium]|nr:peptidylprolyl isomerase [Burkholderiaceae bacterium]